MARNLAGLLADAFGDSYIELEMDVTVLGEPLLITLVADTLIEDGGWLFGTDDLGKRRVLGIGHIVQIAASGVLS